MISLYLILSKKFEKKFSFFLFLITLIYLIFIYAIMNTLRPAGIMHEGMRGLKKYGNSIYEIVAVLLTNPWKTIKIMTSPLNLNYIFKLFVPLTPFVFAGFDILIFGSLHFSINLLCTFNRTRLISYHYSAYLIPFIFAGFLIGAFKLIKLKNSKLLISLGTAILLTAIYSFYYLNPFPLSKRFDPKIYSHNPQTKVFNEIIQYIKKSSKNKKPDRVIIFYNISELGPHLINYTAAYIYNSFYALNIKDKLNPFKPPCIPDYFILKISPQNNYKIRKIINFYQKLNFKTVIKKENVILLEQQKIAN